MKFSKTDVYISNAINSMSNCVSWGPFLACGMTQSVVLIDQSHNNARIIRQLDKHRAIVTCVSWISESHLISADNSSNIIVWTIDPTSGDLISAVNHQLIQFPASIVDIHAIELGNIVYIVCCSESDTQLLQFSHDSQVFQEIHRNSFQPNFVLSINLLHVCGDSVLIFSGLDDGRVMCGVFDTVEWSVSNAITLSGHEDWITSIDSVRSGSHAYVASSSQDAFVRVWKISMDGAECQLDSHRIANIGLSVHLDGVLAGHENWVTQARFREVDQELVLMSTSMDKSVILWSKSREDGSDGQWIEQERLGQIGGNGLGLVGGDMSSDGSLMMGFGYQGDMVVWGRSDSWRTVVNVGGHFAAVEDIAWECVSGRYLISVSADQTARLHAPWMRDGVDCGWHEIARPQVHGFDMTAVASLGPAQFVTGADEKIARVFAMNRQFHDYLQRISEADIAVDTLRDDVVATDALGLSNRTLDAGGDELCDTIVAQPKEESVAGRTLWPEVTKLYGHVFELFRVASDAGGRLVATTCKALLPEYADVILWHTDSWTIAQRLPFHKSTVVRVQFNRAGDRIVTVSKDRQWALWHNAHSDNVQFELVSHSRKPNQHAKIIWDVDWTADDRCFATVSRDKKMMLWDCATGAVMGAPLVFSESVNAISTMPVAAALSEDAYVFAVGLEDGHIKIVQFNKSSADWTVHLSFSAHHDWITRLRFHPVPKDNKYLLASSSKDRFVKIFEILAV